MNQRSRMKKLYPGARGYQSVSVIVIGASGEKQDQWSQPLSAGTDQAEDEISDARIVDPDGFFQSRLHEDQFRSHGVKDAACPDINHRPPRTERTLDLVPASSSIPRRRV